MSKSILFSGLGITFCLGIGRILGFLRDVLVVNFFGKTYAADMAVLILTTQDLLLNFFLGNAFSIALMSGFVGQNNNLENTVYAYHKKITFFLILLIILFIYYINIVIDYLSPGLPIEYKNQLARYLSVSALSIPFIIYASITSAALNFKGIFALPTLGTAIFNFTVCIFLIFSFTVNGVNPFYSIAIGVTLGAILRWFIQFKKVTFTKLVLKSEYSIINIKNFLKVYLGAILSTSSIFIIPIIARIFASKQGMGEISIFNLVSKLIDLPISSFSGVVTTLLIPNLVKTENNWKLIYYSALGLFVFFFFCLGGIYIFSDIIVEILLMFSKFSKENVVEISEQLKRASLMIPSYGVTFFLVAALATTKYSNFYGVLCFTINILFYYFGNFYIKSIDDIYSTLLILYSISGIIGLFLSFFQFKFTPTMKESY